MFEELDKIPFYYKGNINYFDKEYDRLIQEYPKYTNFIKNYFIKKREYFSNQSLNYHNIPNDYRTNIFLENYNGYIKKKLGKK